jgi:hypothetical protein
MQKLILAIVCLIGIVGFSVWLSSDTKEQPNQSFGADFNRIDGNFSFSTSTVATTVTKLLSANAARQYARITNDRAAIIYLGLTTASTTLAKGEGIRLSNGQSYEISVDNLYVGEVWGIASSSASVASILEK